MRPIVASRTHHVYHSTSAYAQKEEAARLIKRDKLFVHNESKTVTIHELAELSLHHTIHPAEYRPTKPTLTQRDVVGTTLLYLDVDNANEHLPYQEALSNLEAEGLFPALIYSTHSHTEQRHRYRIVFQLPYPIKNSEYKILCHHVASFLGKDCVDHSCFTINHAYFPGKEILFVAEDILEISRESKAGSSSTFPQENIYKKSHKPFIGESRRIDLYDEKNQDGAWIQAQRLPMHEIIGVPLDEPFPCHLHEETVGSARVVLLPDGRYMYKCYGNCVFHKDNMTPQEQGIDILSYLQHRYDLDFASSLRKLEELTGFDIETEFERRKKKDIERGIKYMLSKQFKTEQPVVSKFLFRYSNSKWRIYKSLLDYATYYMLNRPMTKRRPNPAFYMSISMLAKFLEDNGIKTSYEPKEVNKKLNELVYYGFIHKHKDSEIPRFLLLKLRDERSYVSDRRGGQKDTYNRKDVYSVNPIGVKLFAEIEKKILSAKSEGVRSVSISQDGLLAWKGVQKMKDTFVQSRKQHMQSISPEKRDFKALASSLIASDIEDKGFAHLGDVKAHMKRQGHTDKRVQTWLSTLLPAILNELELKDQRVNKELRQQLNIPDTVKTGGVILYPKRP